MGQVNGRGRTTLDRLYAVFFLYNTLYTPILAYSPNKILNISSSKISNLALIPPPPFDSTSVL